MKIANWYIVRALPLMLVVERGFRASAWLIDLEQEPPPCPLQSPHQHPQHPHQHPASATSFLFIQLESPCSTSVPATLSIEIATRAADHFTRLFYTTYDSDTRLADLPQFYRPTSSLTWNGTPFSGVDGIRSLIENMPPTKHEIQSFDCHPIPGTPGGSNAVNSVYSDEFLGAQPPSLLVTVSGSVTHGKGPQGNPPNTPAKTIDGQPRVFSQTFMLVPDPTAPTTKPGEVAKYYVGADALRFVG